jgi:hypothetical protein
MSEFDDQHASEFEDYSVTDDHAGQEEETGIVLEGDEGDHHERGERGERGERHGRGNGMIKLTGLWERRNRDGDPRMMGRLSPFCRVVVLKNTRKRKDEDPDWILFLAPDSD